MKLFFNMQIRDDERWFLEKKLMRLDLELKLKFGVDLAWT